MVAGVTLVMFCFLGDAIRANRQISEENMIRERDEALISDPASLGDFQGHPVYSQHNPFV